MCGPQPEHKPWKGTRCNKPVHCGRYNAFFYEDPGGVPEFLSHAWVEWTPQFNWKETQVSPPVLDRLSVPLSCQGCRVCFHAGVTLPQGRQGLCSGLRLV